MNFDQARDSEQAFKHEEIRRYSVAFVQAGLALLDRGVGYVGSDDVQCAVDGTGIAGSAVATLRNAHVIKDHWGSHPGATPPVVHGRRRSKHASANGRKICTYEITSRAMAETFLDRNGAKVVRGQLELLELLERR